MIGFGSSLLSLTLLASPGPVDYSGHQIVRAHARDLDEAELIEQASTHLLSERLGPGPVLVVVDAAGLDTIAGAGIDYEITEADLSAQLAAERARIDAGTAPRDFDDWFSEYKNLEQIYAHIEDLAAIAPELVTVGQIGTSIQGRPIQVVRVGTGAPGRPSIVITGVQHAREWIASMVPVCVLDRLVREPDDPAVLAALAHTDVYIVPIVNPDGFVYTWEGDRYWRKNRRNGIGVDLNRNWAEGWGQELGSSGDPDSDQYRGLNAFSEPETQAVRDFVLGRDDVRALIDFHSFAGVVSSVWAHTDEPPAAADELRAWGDALADQINVTYNYGYRSLHGMEANQTIGYASGSQPDWNHAELGVPAFTIELRPRFDDEGAGGFELPPQAIVPTCEENVAAVLDLARWAGGDLQPSVAISAPSDGQVFPEVPATTDILVDVDYAGPVAHVNLRINGELQAWDDMIYPHDAAIELPKGSWEFVAEVETWDGQTAESAPVTVVVGDEPPDDGPTDDETESGDAPEDSGTEGDPAADGYAARSGCGCSATRDFASPLAFWLLLGLGRRRRRRA